MLNFQHTIQSVLFKYFKFFTGLHRFGNRVSCVISLKVSLQHLLETVLGISRNASYLKHFGWTVEKRHYCRGVSWALLL